jgi:hypothetical protein
MKKAMPASKGTEAFPGNESHLSRMDPGVPVMNSNPYLTYEDAERDYLVKFGALLHSPSQDLAGPPMQGVVDLPADILIQSAEQIANASAEMIRLAQVHLDSEDPIIREGIRFRFIDQATIELLLGIALLQVSDDKTAIQPTAAIRATHSAALRESVSAIEKSSSTGISQGVPVVTSYRASESATADEAGSALRLAVEGTVSNITHRVQELGGDIAFDLVGGMQWAEALQGASLSPEEISVALNSFQKGMAGKILLQVHIKIAALLGGIASAEARLKIQEWLDQIKQAGRIDIFNGLVESFYQTDAPKKMIAGMNRSAATLESMNQASDLIKTLSDKFIVLIGRMRKLEDAIRLGKPIEIPQFRLVTIALQVALLSALVYSGLDYIENGLAGILRETGIG